MYDILTIGDIKLDTFIQIPEASANCELRMPDCKLCIDYGKKNVVNDIDLQIAGSAPNVAVALARMGKKSAVFSQMGDDIIHTLAIDFLKKHNVDTKLVKAQKGYDSSFAAVLNFKGESTQLVSHNSGMYRLPKRIPKTAWLYISEQGKGYRALYKDLIELKQNGTNHIGFNPGSVQIAENKPEFRTLLKHTHVLFVNRVEAEQILDVQEKTEIHALLGGLKQKGPQIIVITDGKHGAYAYDGKSAYFAPMFPGERIEATGAGDAFASGFLGAILNDKSTSEALAWGSVNAASVVGSIGPTKGLLTPAEINKRLKKEPEYNIEQI